MKLTDEQNAVVRHGPGHARVAAVAGAGKTTTMVARVLHLLAQGVPPSRLLVLMFNRAAREDFMAKLARWAPAGQALPGVRTFHSIGHRLSGTLTRWGALAPRELLAHEWQRERLLRQALQQTLHDDAAQLEAALDGDRLEAFGHFCELVKAELVEPQILYERLDFGTETGHFVAAFEAVEALLEQHRLMTYGDLLYRPLRALEADAGLRQRVQGFLDHVIVDEYQDINEVQQRLLAMLAGEQAAVMAVGDANQCIYEWRGARPDTMLEDFTRFFGAAQDYPLSTTFRHGDALALAANHAIAANRRRPDQLCLAAPGNVHTRLSVAQGGNALVETLDVWRDEGKRLDEGCVLVRSWALSVSVQLQLLRAGLPFRLAREDRCVFRLPLVQALAGYLRLARQPQLLQDSAHLLLLLSQPTPFVARERLMALATQLAEGQRWPDKHDSQLAALKPFQRRNLKRRWELLCELPRLAHWPPARLLSEIVERLDAEKVLKRAAARREKGEEDVRLLDVLIEQATELDHDPEAFIALLEGTTRDASAQQKQLGNNAEGVLISTVHGAKGLEWPLVVVWGANEEDFPHYSRDNPLSAERLEEERRLFYVAITRARQRLVVIHAGGKHRPSRFIAESAWDECQQVADVLAADAEQAVPLAVSAPALVQRYLDSTGKSLALRPAATAIKSPAVAAFRIGQQVHHAVFGEGEIQVVEGDPANPVIEVRFRHAGKRRLIALRAPLEPLGEPV